MTDEATIVCRSGYEYPVTQIGDRKYYVYPMVPDFRQRLADIRAMDVRAEDVFVGGLPKSGNVWVFELLQMIMNQTTEITQRMLHHNLIEFLEAPNFAEYARAWQSPRILFYQTRLSCETPADIVKVRPKVLYILRNPKDRLVSAFNYYKSAPGKRQFLGNWEDFLELNFRGDFPPDCWFNHVKDAEKFMEENPELSFHVLVYEKMKEDLLGEVTKLCHFLGKPADMAKEIAEMGEFEKFRQAMEKTKFLNEIPFFRKGIVGDWKNMFTVAQSEAFDQLFESKMAGSKLARLVRPYI